MIPWRALPLLVLAAAACGAPAGGPEGSATGPVPATTAAVGSPTTPQFVDRATAAGITVRNVCGFPDKPFIVDGIGSGACWLDFDRDGHLDLFVVQGSHWPGQIPEPAPTDVLYRARGDGTFEDVTAAAGIHESAWGGGCAAGDLDNDGWPEILVTNQGANVLWKNRGDGRFEDATRAAGVGDTRWGASALLADFDLDGLLDLVVTNYVDFDWKQPPRNGGKNFCTWHAVEVFCGPRGLKPEKPVFYRNRGDGSFADETVAAGIAAAPPTYGLGLVALDYDVDGRADFYMANDSRPSSLFRNLGEGRFEEVGLRVGAALSDTGKEKAGMGVDAGDFDNDGWPDLFVTTFSEDSYLLFHNDRGMFTDESLTRGINYATFTPLGWGTRFFDFDDDGDLDLVAGNGHVYPQVDGVDTSPKVSYLQHANLLRNDAGKFTEVAPSAGPGFAARYGARGLATADYDNDGRLDVLLVNIDDAPALLRNGGSPGSHWLGIELEGRDSNRDGFGARLKLSAPGIPEQVRWSWPGGSFSSSSDPRVHFGLGGTTRADLEITWPSGTVSRYPGLAADSYLRIVEGASSPEPRPQ